MMNRIDDIRSAAHRLFLTRDGEVVLRYLNERFYDCVIKEDQLARQVGRRDVLLEINRLAANVAMEAKLPKGEI